MAALGSACDSLEPPVEPNCSDPGCGDRSSASGGAMVRLCCPIR